MIDRAKGSLSFCWAFGSLSVCLTVCVSPIIMVLVEVFLIPKSCYLSIRGFPWSSFLNGIKNNIGGRNVSLSAPLLQIPICGLTVNQTKQKLSMRVKCYVLKMFFLILFRINLNTEHSCSQKDCKLQICRKNFQSLFTKNKTF